MAASLESAPRRSADNASTGAGMVVGVDGSLGSTHALVWAARHTEQFGPVRPIAAWRYPAWAMSDPMVGAPMPEPPDAFAASARAEAQAALDSIAGVPQDELVLARSAAGPALVEEGMDAALVVVGTRGRGAVADRLLGSVSCHVVAHSSVPVAVVPESASLDTTTPRLVVGVDGSENSIRALSWASANAPDDAVVEAVHVWNHPVGAIPEPYYFPTEYSQRQAERTLQRVIERATKITDDPKGAIVPILEQGDPREVLRRVSSDASMLIVGAQGHRGVAHLLMGSVTTGLIHQPLVTTIVVPAPPVQ